MTEFSDELAEYYEPGDEVIIFRDPDELASKIRFYLANLEERDRVARAGFERTRREHTYDKRFASVAAKAQALRRGGGSQPTAREERSCSMDFEQFREVRRHHVLSPSASWLRRLLIGPCSLIWGPTRGQRAARRLLFDLSWRIAGRQTYTASGLPGRLFYRES